MNRSLIGFAAASLIAMPCFGHTSGSHYARQANPYSLGLATKMLRTGPKVIILLHGATPSPGDSASALIPEPNSGTLDFTRFYFSYPFVREMMGNPSAGLKTLGGINVTGTLWDDHGSKNSSNKVLFSVGCDENTLSNHLIVPGDFTGSATPQLSVMLTYRDGSQRLMAQTKSVLNQIYDKYTALFGSESQPISGKTRPSIIFVVHSMGGPVVRTILSAPIDPIQGSSFTAAERQKAEALRDKTITTVTLAAPHEGSPLATRATELASWLRNDGKAALDTFALVLPSDWRGLVNEARLGILNSIGKDANQDLTLDFYKQVNLGVLSPEKAKRSDNTLIPIYTLIGHTPGGAFFVNPQTQWPAGGILDSLSVTEARRREIGRALGLMFLDYALHNVPTNSTAKSWGTTTNDDFDRVARYHRTNLGISLSSPGQDDGVPFGIPKFYSRTVVTEPIKDIFGNVTGTRTVVTNTDGKTDSDGLVGVSSGHGFRLGTTTNFFFDHSSMWPVNGTSVRGSWYRVVDDTPWRFTNHETIHRVTGTGNWIRDNIVAVAGPIPSTEALSVWPVIQLTPIDRTIQPVILPPHD
jgi:hypothetical protein